MVDGIERAQTYNLTDVFGQDKVFHNHSTLRVDGWETPVSFIYRDERNDVKIRFKAVLDTYAAGFQDEPFVCPTDLSDPVLSEVLFQNYQKAQPLRRLTYAIQQYKREHPEFAPLKLYPRELEHKLRTEPLLPGVFPTEQEHILFDASCYWFPVAVDTYLTGFSNQETIPRDEAVLVSADGALRFGHVGFDGRFYHFQKRDQAPWCTVYTVEGGLVETVTPPWLNQPHLLGLRFRFLRDYVITPSDRCYDYTGIFLETQTSHHQNVRLLNDVMRLLEKRWAEPRRGRITTRLLLPRNFTIFSLADIPRVVIPHLLGEDTLNPTAHRQFLGVAKLLEKVGLSQDFGTALRNIVTLNKARFLGGSKRNVCSDTLLTNLQKLCRKVGSDTMAALLQDEIALKLNLVDAIGIPRVDFTVSNADYRQIRDRQKVPKALRTDAAWTGLAPGTLAVFACDSLPRLYAVTTGNKSGLGLKLL